MNGVRRGGQKKGFRDHVVTDRQMEVFRYLFEYTCEHGYQPSIRGLAAHFGWSGPSAALGFLRALEQKGWLKMDNYRSRGVEFLKTPDGRPFRGLIPRPEEAS